jgi:CheY-like chemotaxis protein
LRIPFVGDSPPENPILGVGGSHVIRVMLIDDDKDEASLTRSLLARVEDIRYELDWVPTFLEGLSSIARGEHHAYLIDHQLGGRTGIELVREARMAGSLAALIMLTGIRDRATDLAAMQAGATDFLAKGKTDATLLDRTLRYSISHVALVSALERSRSQMAGLEEIGRILVDDGPTPATIERVVELIVDRFGQPQIAIYLVDGDRLYPAGQRGYRRPLPNLGRMDAGVDRVFRARQPVFVPSFSPNTGEGNDHGATSTELSVPLVVAGELMGLLNVPSSVADPIGERDFSAIRLVADRLTAALAVTRERRVMEERLWRARQQPSDGEPAEQWALIDGETLAYGRALLVPLLEVAIASAGMEPGRKLGMLLVTCALAGPDSVAPLAARAGTVLAGRPLVRFSKTELAVLLVATDEASSRLRAADLVASGRDIGLDVRCGFAVLAAGWGAGELITAAQAALAFAQRLGPGTVVG